MISVIVPTYNEKENIKKLLVSLKKALQETKEFYEIIFVDDNSSDGTWKELQKNRLAFKLKVFRKQGQKGKAYSLCEGFEKSKGEILIMIDGDLQYPPTAIPDMLKALKESDIVVANRKVYNDSIIRKNLSKTFKFAFGKLMFGLNTDIQSGLKVIKKEVYESIKFEPKSQWTFDLEFLHRANHAGFKIANFDITFHPRQKGESSIHVLKTAWEIGTNALALKAKKILPVQIPPTRTYSMQGAGIGYKKQRFITHSTLIHQKSALDTLVGWQKLLLASLIILTVAGLVLSFKPTLLILIALISFIYFVDVLFNGFLIFKSLNKEPEIHFSEEQIKKINEKNLPIYTILCPLYKEADVLPHFAASIESLDWPKDKLEVLLLLEEDDVVTQKVARSLFLPKYFKVIIVPTSNPKTKPKACNYGLHFATGKYLVIYDAEDRSDPLQLKKAHLAFEKYGNKIGCFQAKLNYYNTHHNLLTRFFTAEYSLWFGLMLPAFQSINTALPLGGTSNHFRTKDIHKFEGWDPFNVTEDADLGVRLFKAGYKTAIIDSTTYEEANSKVGNWLRQRSRWIKGYMQTFLVHNRDIHKFAKDQKIHALLFQLIVGGKIAFIMINPFMWVTTILYFALRPIVGSAIEQFYPGPVFYMAAFCLVAGNFLYLYYYMIAAVKQEKFNIVKFIFLIPFYWLMISAAFWIAAYQLIFKPHYWEKTVHGLHLDFEKKQEEKILLKAKAEEAQNERVNRLKNLINSGIAAGGVLVAAGVFGNILNFIYSTYLARSISVEDFGLVSLVGSFLALSTIPLNALTRTVSHKTAFYLGKYQYPLKDFWAIVRNRAIIISLLLTLIWILLTPYLVPFFQAPSWLPFILFAPVWLIATASAVDSGFLSGNLRFHVIAMIMVTESALKLIFTFALVTFGFPNYVYAAIPASLAGSFLIGWIFARSVKSPNIKLDNDNALNFPKGFFATSILTGISTVAFLSFDVILVKHFMSPTLAGQYALVSLVGKMIYFVGNLFNQFINPLVSREEGASRNSNRVFYKIFFLSTLASFSAYLAVGLFGFISMPIFFGQKVNSIVNLLPIYGLSIFGFTAASSIVSFYQVKKKKVFVISSFFFAIFEVLGIYFFHNNLEQVTYVMAAVGIASLATTLFLHFTYKSLIVVGNNIKDFLNLFSVLKNQEVEDSQKLNILIFNWRDTKHVWAGGAEVYIHEIAKRLVKQGHRVTIFCGNDTTSPRNEVVDGVQVVRRGGFYTVYIWAFLYYVLRFRGKFDIIIDSENGIPFFTPLYTRTPVIGLVHHVHQEVFRGNLIWPLAVLGKFLEGRVMPIVYRNVQMVTVSQSSKEDLEKIGFGKRKQVEIIHPGVDFINSKLLSKTKSPTILYLGRLKPYKSIENVIKIMPALLKKIPDASLIIAGEGESKKTLEELVDNLNLTNVVKFLGKVSEETKNKLLATSWVMVQPSKIEGWGITVIEANAHGTPVIASDVPGLRDSVKNPHSGLLVTWDNKEKWTKALTDVLTDNKLRNGLSTYSIKWAKKFSWDKNVEKLLTIIEKR